MWLVVGGDSEIGAAVYRRLLTGGLPVLATTRRRKLVGPERPFLDLAAPLENWEPPEGTRGACIAAGIARLADCAADPISSAAVNVTGTLALVQQLIARGVHVLFLSSNQVFDGTHPHVAADAPTCPVSEYGRQKTRTESALRAQMERGAAVAILRVAKVISPTMPLFRQWVGALGTGQRVSAFGDMRLAPTPIEVVVDAIVALMTDRVCGVFQLTGPRDVTYADVARYFATRVGVESALVESVSAAAAGEPIGATPPHTTLDSSALHKAYGLVVPDIWETVDPFVPADRWASASKISKA